MKRSKSFDVIYERLLEASGTKTDSELARVLGISPQSVNGARERGNVPPAWVQSYAEISGVSSDWLFFGRGPMRPGEPTEQPMPATRIAAPAAPDPSPLAACPRCAKLEARLERVEAQRDELLQENRQLWKENGEFRERLARHEERAIKLDMENVDPQPRLHI